MLCYDTDRETKARRLPFFYGGIKHPPNERKEGDAMVTYSDMIQFCIFIVALDHSFSFESDELDFGYGEESEDEEDLEL